MQGAYDVAAAAVGMAVNASLDKKNRKFVQEQNALNREFAHNEASLAWQRQLEMTDKVNAWNSYSNQRKLLQSAGYNPNALFNSASTLSASSGSSSAPQASTPNTGYTQPFRFDPALLSDVALKVSQARNIDADTDKKRAETIGQDLQNSYQSTANKIFDKFGMLEKELDLNYTDSMRAVNDAQRLVLNSQHSLNYDELFNLRPKQATKLISDTVVADASSLLLGAQTAKTETERDYIVKNFILQSYIADATVSKLYSEKAFINTQNSLWQPDGILYKNSLIQYGNGKVNKALSEFQLNSRKQFYNDMYVDWKYSVRKELQSRNLYNDKVADYLDSFELNRLGGALVNGLTLGRVPVDYRNPGPPTSAGFSFPF